jgi:hypothetical protein
MSRDDGDVPRQRDESTDDAETDAAPSSQYGPYRVRGSLDVDGSGDTPTGVLGVTTGDGETYGVQGVTTTDGVYRLTYPAGVYGRAATSGATVGVKGVTDGESIGAAGVRAEASHEDADALYAENAQGTAIDADGGNATDPVIDAATGEPTNVLSATNNASGDVQAGGVYALVQEATGDNTTAVEGVVQSGSGRTYGVRGRTFSPDPDAAGVRGAANARSGATGGVVGETRSRDVDAAGVVGRQGRSGTDAMLADATSFGNGNGLKARTDSTNNFAVWAENSANGTAGDNSHAVYASNDTVGTPAVEASGGLGATATSGPALDVSGTSRSDTQTPPAPDEHAALVVDEAQENSSVLALRTFDFDPLDGGANEEPTNFVTFYDGFSNGVGAIEGDGNNTLVYTSGGADYAEFLPRRDPDEAFEPGDVVGTVGGEVTADTADADQAMVVTSHPVVTGNDPGPDPGARADHERVAFVGQAPTKVRGPVERGDVVVPSGENDGTARAVDPDEWTPRDRPIVGQAWGSDDSA